MSSQDTSPTNPGEAAAKAQRPPKGPRRLRLFRRREERAPRRPWVNPWNLANMLSVFRILATIPLVLLILANTSGAYLAAFWTFIVVAITDTIDGRLARRYGWVSNIGIFLDLTADKIYTAGILVAMVSVSILDPWAAIIILVREFVVTGLRSFAAAEGHVIPAGRWGKLKMLVTIVAIAWILGRANFDRAGLLFDLNYGGVLGWLAGLSSLVLWAAVALTIMSGVEYLWGARGVFQQPPRQSNP